MEWVVDRKYEIWKDIPEYEGEYQVSSLGNVKSCARIDAAGRKWKERILKASIVKGYYKVTLYHDGIPKMFSIHRLVAMAFIPNPNNYPVINHKDENPLNNYVDNLEWCTVNYNIHYGTALQRSAIAHSKALKGRIIHPEMQKSVAQIDIKTNVVINKFISLSEAARQCGLRECKISLVCNGFRHTHGGFKWQFV